MAGGIKRSHQLDDRIAGQEADGQCGSAGCGAPESPPRGAGGREQGPGILEELTPGRGYVVSGGAVDLLQAVSPTQPPT